MQIKVHLGLLPYVCCTTALHSELNLNRKRLHRQLVFAMSGAGKPLSLTLSDASLKRGSFWHAAGGWETPWHSFSNQEALSKLQTDPDRGLDEESVRQRRAQMGENILQEIGRRSWPVVLLRQFLNSLIAILLVAALVAALVGQIGDALTILAIVLLNGLLGFLQEWRAEQSLQALRWLVSPQCRVVRSGVLQTIDSRDLVPGDVVELEIGDRVPADVRLLESVNLRADESTLTGESTPVHKDTAGRSEDSSLNERTCIAWMGSSITNGRALGVVVATGMASAFGGIAALTQSIGDEGTPLQNKLAELGKMLGLISILLSAMVVCLGWVLGKPLVEMVFMGIALAVAIVPEALPAVVTITLALGVRSMIKRHVLLRRLQAAETLGATTVICTDKTGTLTTNQITVKVIGLPTGMLQVTGDAYDPAGHFEADGKKADYSSMPDLLTLLRTGLICNHARITKTKTGWQESGDPTEAAIVVAAYKAWLAPSDELETVCEFSFNSTRKRMTVIVREEGVLTAHVKGAPEVILDRCAYQQVDGGVVPLGAHDKAQIKDAYETMARDGHRVLAFATRAVPESASFNEDNVERYLTYLGFMGMMDPPRPEVPKAIRLAQSAGIRVVMITGDAHTTAVSIARRIGLKADHVLTGQDLSQVSDTDLRQALAKETLFARTTPDQKLRIVRLLQGGSDIVAMTGDGVNDAPALKQADVGIAMGQRGTDVAKGAADMILMDDNFASIIGAVAEGRRQFENIRKFVRYILSSHMGEVVAIVLNLIIGGPLILLPVQILWMNLVTDGMTAIALGMEPGESDRMTHPPRDPNERLPNKYGLIMIAATGTYIALATVWLFYFYMRDTSPETIALAQTMAFTGIIVLEKVNVFNFRCLGSPLGTVGYFSNKWLFGAVALTLGAQICAVYIPFLQRALHTVPLRWEDWVVMFVVSVPLFFISEGVKLARSRAIAAIG